MALTLRKVRHLGVAGRPEDLGSKKRHMSKSEEGGVDVKIILFLSLPHRVILRLT